MSKEFRFLCTANELVRGYVSAESIEEAREMLLRNEYDDIDDTYETTINGIVDLWECKE